MKRLNDGRTRIVTWLKVILPLVALGLLSTLFLLARTTDPDVAIRYSDLDVAELSRDQQVASPTFSGTTRDGASLTIAASTVRPRNGAAGQLDADRVTGRIEFLSGTTADLAAPTAEVDTDADAVRFMGGVTVTASDGHSFATDTLLASLDETDVLAETPVTLAGPFGTLDAGSMRVTQDGAGGYLAVFKGGVRLIYDPSGVKE